MNDRVQVLRNDPGLFKLLTLFKEKYCSLGRVGGTVSIKHFPKEEVESIAGFMGESVSTLIQKGKISLLEFEKELSHTIFADFSLVQLLEEVFQQPIVTKNKANQLEAEKDREFFRALRQVYPEGSWWWDWIESRQPDTRWIWSLYKQAPVDFFEKITIVFKAFLSLPSETGRYERLPLFAQRITGNPHFFDSNQTAGKLLVHCLQTDQHLKGLRESGMPKTTEELNDLLSCYGLMRDDLWSFVSCRGFLAQDDAGIHKVWKAAAETGTVLNVPMKEILKLKRIWPFNGNKVWIVENSSVCSTIVDEVPEAPVICTHGQFRAASWMFLDLLVETGCRLYYSGDLDPEGLLMAQRLKDRYQRHVSFWRMDRNSYELSISEEDVSARLAKIKSITAPELLDTINALMERKKAGYQEGLVNELINDMKCGMK
jgi:uncharacterized protein (TIGR02679 family)